ncbi:acyl carrier protein [Actinomadura barringtoniae]|uniref:Acyl carrier protein n=1 Tax=Actinomadura barringtoniae TaxID=1427535 RepID=A0A939PHN0_9ACTN|nr:phosphopantetheine-binding protein [Actinomadura barringtoniae]MBO2450273.1 acyl carrier protein [Actinomadura barringtoniae]
MEAQFATLIRPYLRFLPEGEEVKPDSRLRDLGLDSMQAIELLFDIEDSYQVTLPDERLNDQTFETADSLWRAVDDERGPGGPS